MTWRYARKMSGRVRMECRNVAMSGTMKYVAPMRKMTHDQADPPGRRDRDWALAAIVSIAPGARRPMPGPPLRPLMRGATARPAAGAASRA